MIYKNHVVSIPLVNNETNEEYGRRSWFVAKNISMINSGEMDMKTLIGFSHIHLKIEIYNHTFNSDIMKTYELLKKQLYCF